jgi:hypothetical protein
VLDFKPSGIDRTALINFFDVVLFICNVAGTTQKVEKHGGLESNPGVADLLEHAFTDRCANCLICWMYCASIAVLF